jgi:hypothetical protein
MEKETAEEYHGNEASHGNYQYVTLKEVIDGLTIEQLEPDSYIKNTNRNIFLYHARMGLKDLIRKVSAEFLAIEMTVGYDGCIVLPQDYVGKASVSVVFTDADGSIKLFPLDRNNNINTATGILQENDSKIIFDNDGNILTADASNAYNVPHKSYEYFRGQSCGDDFLDGALFSVNGEYKVDTLNGKIVFDSRLIGRDIVLKYKSDGLQWEYFQEAEIRVPKYMEQTLKDLVYFKTIEKRMNVPQNEKNRALNRYETSRFESVKEVSGISLKAIARTMRSKSKF